MQILLWWSGLGCCNNKLPGKADTASLWPTMGCKISAITILQVGPPESWGPSLAFLNPLSQSWETLGLCIRHCFLAASICKACSHFMSVPSGPQCPHRDSKKLEYDDPTPSLDGSLSSLPFPDPFQKYNKSETQAYTPGAGPPP